MRASLIEGPWGRLPDDPPAVCPWEVRASARLDLHAVSRPARTFTGDFYFTHRYEDGIWVVLGDVAGKGLPAAVAMAMIQEELEHRIADWVATRSEPARIMLHLHSFLEPLLPPNRFATAVVGHLWDDGTFAFANAGHCPPLIARRDSTVEDLPSTGPMIGLLPRPRWTSEGTRLAQDETLLLYSDGLVEATSGAGEAFGSASLSKLLSRASGLGKQNARKISEAILAALDRHTRGERQDDQTLVVVKRVARASMDPH
jgi:phosphoserine phosphatase RsbU/P